MHNIRGLQIAGLHVVCAKSVIALGPGDGPHKGTVVHLLRKLREDFGNLNSRDRCLNWIQLSLTRGTRLWIPRIQMTHSPAVPKENDMFSLCLLGFPSTGNQLR